MIRINSDDKYWTLSSGDIGTSVCLWQKSLHLLSECLQVTVTVLAENSKDQIWKIIPFKPMYKIRNLAQEKDVGCTEKAKEKSPIGVVSSQTASLTIFSLPVLT